MNKPYIKKMGICPVCKGSGVFEQSKAISLDAAEIKKKIVIQLHKKGYGIRQIQRALGYVSPQSVAHILNYKKKQA